MADQTTAALQQQVREQTAEIQQLRRLLAAAQTSTQTSSVYQGIFTNCNFHLLSVTNAAVADRIIRGINQTSSNNVKVILAKDGAIRSDNHFTGIFTNCSLTSDNSQTMSNTGIGTFEPQRRGREQPAEEKNDVKHENASDTDSSLDFSDGGY